VIGTGAPDEASGVQIMDLDDLASTKANIMQRVLADAVKDTQRLKAQLLVEPQPQREQLTQRALPITEPA
jgi:hypothetical protein